jgi:hypothetical protein
VSVFPGEVSVAAARLVRLYLTERGRAAREPVREARAALERHATATLTAEREHLTSAPTKIVRGEHGGAEHRGQERLAGRQRDVEVDPHAEPELHDEQDRWGQAREGAGSARDEALQVAGAGGAVIPGRMGEGFRAGNRWGPACGGL